MQVKVFGSEPNALLYSVAHQLSRTSPSEDTIRLFRCLIADEVESQPPSFLAACGVPCPTSEDVSQFAFRLRIGRHDGGLVTLVVLPATLGITIFLHSLHQGSRRYDPSIGASSLSIHLLEAVNSSGSVYGSIVQMNHAPSRPLAPRRNQPDPMMVALKVAKKELMDSQMTEHPPIIVDPKQGLRFASLNVNGCRTLKKREAVDSLLFSQRVHIAVLQEVNLDCQSVYTTNFLWQMSGSTSNRKRGLAVLIRHGLDAVVQKSIFSGANIQHAEIKYQVTTICSSFFPVNTLFLRFYSWTHLSTSWT